MTPVQSAIRMGLAAALWAASAAALEPAAIVARNEAAVAIVTGVKPPQDKPVQGSGCFVHPDGYILATAHQVMGVKNLQARLLDGTTCPLDVVDFDEAHEVALLKAPVQAPRVVEFGDPAGLRSGAFLLSIASPMGLDFTTVTGIVSHPKRKHRRAEHLPYFPVIQADLPASPGSSGGPVFDRDGRLVGLIIGKLPRQEWITLVNPVSNAFDLLAAHGVADAPDAMDGQDQALLPADGLSAAQRQAIRDYNRGVHAQMPEDKVALYRAAVRGLPEFFEAWFNLAAALRAARDGQGAVEAYERAGALEPDRLEVWRNLGRVYLEQGQAAAAAACFERAVALAPDSASAHNDLGEALRRAGQMQEAENAFRTALKLRPGYAAVQFNLGLTLAAAGQDAQAAAAFKAYLDLAPNAADAEQVRVWIDELGRAGS